MPSKISNKEKRSFTLSRSSVVFLEQLKRERKISSASRVLDELIREDEARQRLASIEAAIGDYYDRLSEPERREQEAWGRFALEQLGDNW
jgi:hypothetical protein